MNIRCAAIVLAAWTMFACSGRGEVTVYGPGPDDDTRDSDDEAQDTSVTVGPSTGTGGDDLEQRCQNWCFGTQNCPDPLFGDTDCVIGCRQLGDLVDLAGCTSDYRSLLDCVDLVDIICDAASSCAGSFTALSSCLSQDSR